MLADYDAWAAGFPGFVDTDPANDPDGDDVINEDEYAFGLDPTDSASFNSVPTPLDKGTGIFTYTRRNPGLTGLTYTIESSPDLLGWTTDGTAVQSVTGTVDDVETVEVTLTDAPLTATKLFARAVATP